MLYVSREFVPCFCICLLYLQVAALDCCWYDAGCSWVLLLCFLASVLLWLWKPVPLAFWEPVPLLFLFFCYRLCFALLFPAC